MLIPIDTYADFINECASVDEVEAHLEKFASYLERAYLRHQLTTGDYWDYWTKATDIAADRNTVLKG